MALSNVYILASNGNFVTKDELYHYGVKGMKWGVRRYQRTDGSLTSAGRKRYSDDQYSERDKKVQNDNVTETGRKNFIQKRKDKLTDHYVSKGYSPSAAKTMAEQRMRTEAILAAVGAVAVTAVAIKVSRRIGQDYFDHTFKAGATIQNIGAKKATNFKDAPFFAAVNRSDKKTYGMNFPYEKRRMARQHARRNGLNYEGIYKNDIKLTGDVKRASVANSRKIFYDLMDKDPQFKKDVLDTLEKTNYSDIDASISYSYYGKRSRKLYDRFNQALATRQFQDAGIHKKYYDEMKKHGYNAILDINDTRYSGYKKVSKSPTIFFGDAKWEKVSSRKLSDLEIEENVARYTRELALKSALKSTAETGAAVGAVASISSEAAKQRVVKQYLKEHPDSKLSREEILDLYGG